MLLNAGEEERTNLSRAARYVGLPVAALLLVETSYLLYRAWPSDSVVDPNRFVGRTAPLAHLLFTDFALPFELTSILILIAILGAIVLAKKDI